MVDESLKEYLKQKLIEETDMKEEDIEIGLGFLINYTEKEHLFTDKQKDIFVEKSLSFGSLETILSCIKVGMGKSLLPTSIVKKMGYDKDIRITVLPKKEANIPTCLVCRKDYIPKISDYLKNMEL